MYNNLYKQAAFPRFDSLPKAVFLCINVGLIS